MPKAVNTYSGSNGFDQSMGSNNIAAVYGTFPPSAPAVPATGVPAQNPSGIPATVVLSGGTLTGVTVDGNPTNLSLTYTVHQSIAWVGSGAPTWTWTWPTPAVVTTLNLHAGQTGASG